MNTGRRPLKRIILMTFLPVLLTVMVVAVPAFLMADSPAGAVTAGSQWNTLKGYVNSFFAGQYQYSPSTDGEAGFTIDRSTLKSRIDSNGDMSPTGTNSTTTVTGVLGEGDDAANAPVLLDNISGNANMIPGTSIRCNWNQGYGTTTADNCFDLPKVTEIAGKVNAHAAAGFSTDIVVYCVSGRTESAVSGGMGTLAQTGALGDSDPNTGGNQAPKVLAYKWGRNGWTATSTTTQSTTGTTGAVSAPSTTYGDGTGSASICSGAPTDAELVRCTAQWAIYGTGTGDTANWLTPSATSNGAGYNINNGVTTLTSSNQVIDIRTPSPATTATVSGGPTTLKIPVNTLFGSSVNFMDTRTTATKNVFVGRTTHVAGMAAINAVMLGYNSSFLAHGVNAWNTSLGGESYQTGIGMDTPTYPLQTATANNESAYLDTTAPGITTPSAASAITTSSADISRVANEPATMKVEYGTSPGVYTNTANNTVLNASKTVALSGLSEYTTYYVKVTSYDGQANGTAETEFNFTTLDTTAPSITNLAPSGTIYTGSTTISADYSDGGSGINSSTAKIFLDGSPTELAGCTATGAGISCPVTGLAYGAHTFSVEVKDNANNTATNTGGSFTVGDNVAPTVTYGSPGGNINTGSPTITGTYSDPAPSSGVDTTSATVSVDAGAPQACTASGGTINCPVTGLADGAHSAVISIKDNDNNTGTNSPAGSFTVDTTVPSITNLLPSTTNYNGAPTISADYSDATAGIDSGSAKIFLDGSVTAMTGCTPTGTGISCPTTGLAYGSHTFSVEVRDNANNLATNSTGAFTVGDNVAPTVTYSAPTGTINTSSTTITGTYSDAAPSSGVNTTSATVSIDSGAPQACTASGGNISCSVSGLADGLRSAVISIKDNDNNTGSSTAGTFTVNTAAPTVTADNIGYQPGNWTNDTTPALSATITDVPVGQNILGGSILIDGSPCDNPPVNYNNTSVSCTPLVPLSEGAYSVVYSAYYSVGNSGVSPIQTINIDTTNPAVSNIAPSGWTTNTGPTITADLSDTGGSGIVANSASVSIDSGAALTGCTKTTTSISCPTSGLSTGSHTIDVSVNDNTGNTGTGSGSFSIDTTNPVVSNVTPSGWTASGSPTIEADLSDGSGSGINAGSATISLDGGPALTGCTPTGTHISCPATGLSDGSHSIAVSVNDSVGNTGTGSGSFDVDTTDPVVSSVAPTGWTNSTGPTVTANLSDGSGSGIVANTASISLNGGPALTDCTKTATSISCPTSGLAEGAYAISVNVDDSVGNTGSGSGSFSVDTTGPAVTALSPSGSVGSSSFNISASLADTGGSGVNASSSRIYLNGSPTALTGCTATVTSISCPATVGLGSHTFSVYAVDSAGNETTNSSGSFSFTQRSYYATWYDNDPAGGVIGNWLMINNEDSTTATVDIYINDMTTPVADDVPVAAGAVVPWTSPTTVTNGPVKVVSTTGQALGVSQRVIYRDSFNEVEALEGSTLTNEYNFPWYDNNAGGGMTGNWVMVANMGDAPTTVDIFVGDMTTPVANDVAVAAGTSVPWQSPTPLTDGPVKVVGASAGDKLVVSQRVIYGASFNETTGIATSRLDDEAWFTWYDNNPASGMTNNWVMVGNLGSANTTVDIYVGDMTTPKANDVAVDQNGVAYWQSPVTLSDGPVKVVGAGAGDKLVVSQRVLYRGSFEETAPTYAAELGSNADFTWYDNNPAGGVIGNWVMAANADTTNANVDIAVTGSTAGTLNPVNANGGKSNWISPTTVTNGPVRVTNTGSAKLVISQRVIYKNSFNELVGRPRT